MHMRYVRELSLKEISLITGQTTNATAVQLHRGLEKLKLLYTPPNDKQPGNYYIKIIILNLKPPNLVVLSKSPRQSWETWN